MRNLWTITDKYCEIRFKSSANLLKDKLKLHESLFKFFPEITEPNVTTYVYQNSEKGLTLSVTNKNCVLTGQMNTSESEHKTTIKTVWPIIKKVLDISKVERIGVREMCLIQNEEPQTLSAKLNTAYLGLDNHNYLEFHINLSSVKETKGYRLFSSNHIFQNVDTINPNNSIQMRGLLYDIDVFEENIMQSKDSSCINELYERIKEVREKISEPVK